MKKVINFGKVKSQGEPQRHKVELEVELCETNNKPVFSVRASLWKADLSDIIWGGQCVDDIWKEFHDQLENKELYEQIMNLWKKYHLNDMNGWCEHQNYGKDTQEIKIYHLKANEEYGKLSKIRELPSRYLEVSEEGLKNVPSGLYSIDKEEIKSSTWVHYDKVYSPEGLLGKVCPICGAKHGHEWYYRPIPEEDLRVIKSIIGA